MEFSYIHTAREHECNSDIKQHEHVATATADFFNRIKIINIATHAQPAGITLRQLRPNGG